MAEEAKNPLDEVKSGALKKTGEYLVVGALVVLTAITGGLYGLWPWARELIASIWRWFFHWKESLPIWLIALLILFVPLTRLVLSFFWQEPLSDKEELTQENLILELHYHRDIFDGIVWQWKYDHNGIPCDAVPICYKCEIELEAKESYPVSGETKKAQMRLDAGLSCL